MDIRALQNKISSVRTSEIATKSHSHESSGASTPITTDSNKSSEGDDSHVYTNPKNSTLSVLDRDYPEPDGELSIAEALERQPGRWTLQGQMTANRRRADQLIDDEEAKEKRRLEFEATKMDLLKSHHTLS